MNPTNMPATVVAEALVMFASLGKPIGTQPLTAKQQKADAIANAIPIAEQGAIYKPQNKLVRPDHLIGI